MLKKIINDHDDIADSVLFTLLPADEIIRMSACQITETRMTGEGTLYDERMGVTTKNKKCLTCDQNEECPGHFGYIELNEPIYHPMFLKQILQYLRVICMGCKRVILTKETFELLKLSGGKILEKVEEAVKSISHCLHCYCEIPKIFIQDGKIFVSSSEMEKSGSRFYAKSALRVFESVPEDDYHLLGIKDHRLFPVHLILRIIPVAPPMIRPPVMMNSYICDDDLTYKYVDIIKTNKKVRDFKAENKKDAIIDLLDFHVKTLFDNSSGKAKHVNQRPLKCFKTRLNGKQGQIRKYLNGKRSNFNARTVIGPEPNINIDTMVVPTEIANKLTFPEVVNDLNFSELDWLVNTGKASYVVRGENRINLKYATGNYSKELSDSDRVYRDKKFISVAKSEIMKQKKFKLKDGDIIFHYDGTKTKYSAIPTKRFQLKNGDIVERYLQNNDYMILNRQPTLHKGSMLGFKIKILPVKTIRFSLAMCNSFNSDFDGDEMNIHMPQSYQAKAELMEISSVKNNFTSTQGSKPIVNISQDHLLSGHLMTKENKKIDEDDFMNFATWDEDVWPLDEILDKLDHYRDVKNWLGLKNWEPFSTFTLFSLCLPKTFNYSLGGVKIVQGLMVNGTLNKDTLGNKSKSIPHYVFINFGEEEAVNFVSKFNKISNEWLFRNGFSIGISDCVIDQKYDNIIQTEIEKRIIEAKTVSEMETNDLFKEIKINMSLNKATDIGNRLARDYLPKDNRLKSIVESGSKGSFINIAQIIGLLGQQNISGKRIPLSFGSGKPIPHYPSEDKILDARELFESRGFVTNSYIRGLTPQEFWYHAGSGREGLLDTACKTGVTGYIQRKIVKLLEDLKTSFHDTIVNNKGTVYSFQYGDDNLDGSQLINIDGSVQFADVNSIVSQLNDEYELTNNL